MWREGGRECGCRRVGVGGALPAYVCRRGEHGIMDAACRLTAPSCCSVCFMVHAATSHRATDLPAAVARSPLSRKVTAFTCTGHGGGTGEVKPADWWPVCRPASYTTLSWMSAVEEPAISAWSSPRPSLLSIRWSPAPAAISSAARPRPAPPHPPLVWCVFWSFLRKGWVGYPLWRTNSS